MGCGYRCFHVMLDKASRYTFGGIETLLPPPVRPVDTVDNSRKWKCADTMIPPASAKEECGDPGACGLLATLLYCQVRKERNLEGRRWKARHAGIQEIYPTELGL